MVGTFYRASQPGAPPFVEEGDVVAAGQTLCILEAMKLMNEVKADVEAVVRRSTSRTPSRRVRAAAVRARAARRPAPRRGLAHVLPSPRREPRRDRRARDPRAARARHRGGRRVLDGRRGRAPRAARRPRRADRPACCGAELPQHPGDRRRRHDDRLRGGASGLRLPLRERRVRARVRGQRPRLHRPARRA